MLYMFYVLSVLRSPVPLRGFQLLRFFRLSRRKSVRRNFWSCLIFVDCLIVFDDFNIFDMFDGDLPAIDYNIAA